MNWVSRSARESSLILLSSEKSLLVMLRKCPCTSKRYSAVHGGEMTQFGHLLRQNAARGREGEMKQVWQDHNYGSSQVRGQEGLGCTVLSTSACFENFLIKSVFK